MTYFGIHLCSSQKPKICSHENVDGNIWSFEYISYIGEVKICQFFVPKLVLQNSKKHPDDYITMTS